jgi:anhydro-N-acetylmuramic acid kinase
MSELYIGLMSGTSTDGIDVVLADFSQYHPTIIATHYAPYSPILRAKILALCQPGENEIQRLGELDIALGREFALAVNNLLAEKTLKPSAIKAIGSHGQTIRHHPQHFTLQIGDPNTIAAETRITTIADFRRKDVAYGGQGAPLIPAFHRHILPAVDKNRAIVNIGGIANVTVLLKKNSDTVIGFDTGPGNVLLDAWTQTHQKKSYDKEGIWGAQGIVHIEFLEKLLSDSYFQQSPPKSTGREYFNLAWLEEKLYEFKHDISPVNLQATLVELTACSIISAIRSYMTKGEILICGGGIHNAFLLSRLQALAAPSFTIHSTQKYGVHPDWIEALAFAWLARQTLHRHPGNLPSVTGAKCTAILGGVYWA